MGIGDEIMVTGEVVRRAAGAARVFAIRDLRKGGMHRWHEIWAHNPRIAPPGKPHDDVIFNHGGNRPYILEKNNRRFVWCAYGPTPGEIFLTAEELVFSRAAVGKVLLHPNIKDGASPNKAWGFRRWQRLVDEYPTVPWLQIGPAQDQRLRGVPFHITPDFRAACGAVSGARAVVVQEGGLHHAAAALRKPAVVIFGAFIAPVCTGYGNHANLFIDSQEHPLGCGTRMACLHCENAMAAITPKRVRQELEQFL